MAHFNVMALAEADVFNEYGGTSARNAKQVECDFWTAELAKANKWPTTDQTLKYREFCLTKIAA